MGTIDKISISEYAKIKGISKQAVYKRLNNKLKDFVKVEDGKKYISAEALTAEELERLTEVEQQVEQELNNQNQPFWEKQIEEKDRVIQGLMQQIENLQEQNKSLTDLLKSNQILFAADKKFLLEQETTTSREKKGIFGLFKKRK